MPVIETGWPSGLMGRGVTSNDTPGQRKVVSYVTSAGVDTNEPQFWVRVYNGTGGTLTKYACYMINWTGVASTGNPQIIACTTSTPTREIVVATEAALTTAWTWVIHAGVCDALVDGTTDVAVSDFLKLTSGTSATAFIKDGTSYTTSSHAIAMAASTLDSANQTKIYLIGGNHLVA